MPMNPFKVRNKVNKIVEYNVLQHKTASIQEPHIELFDTIDF